MAVNPQNNLDPKDLQQIEQYLRDSGLSAQDLVVTNLAIFNGHKILAAGKGHRGY
jgi:hypothetical protein